MKQDIHKLAAWLEKVCQEGVALQHKVLEWKLSETKSPDIEIKAKAS